MLAFFFGACAARVMIVPQPNSIEETGQIWTLLENSEVTYDETIEKASEVAQFICDTFANATGFKITPRAGTTTHGIYLANTATVTNKEGYEMVMDTDLVTIGAQTRDGLFYGFQTLLQLLPVAIYSKTVSEGPWTAPTVRVVDEPRFEWRGIMLDPCRHFINLSTMYEIIDGLSRFKINRVHLHLTDDQGWRIESKKFPKLTEVGSIRDSSPVMWDRWNQDGVPYGPYFYTQEQIKEVIAFAHQRSITIVPELEMPGHAMAALSAVPEYSCTGGQFKPWTQWGVSDEVYCAGNDAAIDFLEALVDEFIEIFDSEFFHVGGDECPKTRWRSCSKCQARMRSLGLSTEDQLQSWVIQHFSTYLASKGRRLIGWDEILEGGLADGAAVMSWRGTSGGTAAAMAGHQVVMSPNTALYLDYAQFSVPEQYEYIGGLSTLWMCYHYNPTDGIEESYKHYVIGVQGNSWSEYTWGREDLEYKLFPRGMAVAETGWTMHENMDWISFVERVVQKVYPMCDQLGINHCPITLGEDQEWFPDEIPTDRWVNMEWSFDNNIGDAHAYGVEFVHTGGTNSLKMKNVQLKFGGQVVASDDHEGIAQAIGGDNNAYSFQVSSTPGSSKVTVSADVQCIDGSNTRGKVVFYRA